jgi:hypothetical protein
MLIKPDVFFEYSFLVCHHNFRIILPTQIKLLGNGHFHVKAGSPSRYWNMKLFLPFLCQSVNHRDIQWRQHVAFAIVIA